MKILLTAFTPFNGETVNPSMKALESLEGKLAELDVTTLTLPTVFYRSIKILREQLLEIRPDILIMVGQAGDRREVTPERVAINLIDARIPDNDGVQPIDEKIFEDGKNAYFSTLPVKAMVKEMRERGIPSSVSNSAGTFVCNHLMYGALYTIEKEKLAIKAGFLHVPCLEEQTKQKKNAGSLPLSVITEAVAISVRAAVNYKADLNIPLGKEA